MDLARGLSFIMSAATYTPHWKISKTMVVVCTSGRMRVAMAKSSMKYGSLKSTTLSLSTVMLRPLSAMSTRSALTSPTIPVYVSFSVGAPQAQSELS